MDFLNNLTEKGFTVKCMVEGENEYENKLRSEDTYINFMKINLTYFLQE